jgi:crotonobetainyl-CoA:carnitine CoA-transferase CaiB-like acyl-CoA transferase
MTDTTAKTLLDGIRIIDLSSVVFGPYCTQILTDLGADVIKIESPEGDAFRFSAKSARSRGMSPGHLTLNRGKRSAVLNLKNPDDLAVMQGQLAKADVFVHNVRGKAIERLSLGYEAVKALNEKIIYVHCVGFGSDGPYADLQAYDDVIQAATGTASLPPRVDGNPRPRYIPSLIADKVAGLHAAYATLAAIVYRQRTGQGQFVEVPMFETFTHFMLREHFAGQTFEPPVGPICYARQVEPHRQPFPTADGYISLVPYTDQSLFVVFRLLGAPEFLQTDQFSTAIKRAKGMDVIYREIGKLTPTRTTQQWLDIFREASIPAMAVREISTIRDDPHLQEVGFFALREHPTEGKYYEMRSPVKFGAVPTEQLQPAPALGQHTEEVKAEVSNTHSAATRRD